MTERTPEQLGREAGEAIANAIADNLETVIVKLADSIAKVQEEQAEQAEAIRLAHQRLDNFHGWLAKLDEHVAPR